VERLQEYRKRLILFPRRVGKAKKGDASAEEVKAAKNREGALTHVNKALAIENKPEFQEASVSEFQSTENAYRKLRDARSEARLVGVREKRAKAKAEEASAAKK